jgi:ribosomal protein S18 acetylase RimI-like enzyme
VDVAVSAAAISDVPSLADLWKTMVEDHRRLVGDQWPVREADLAWRIRQRQYENWLAEDTGFLFIARSSESERPLGYAACRLMPAGPTFDLGEIHGEIDSLVTAEDARGQGIGSSLLTACREELKRRGTRYWSIGVVEANTRAIELYERLGFRPFVRSMLAPLE